MLDSPLRRGRWLVPLGATVQIGVHIAVRGDVAHVLLDGDRGEQTEKTVR
ncbi:hypothetical protein [uncultured Microbacterium sp.]|nr:hypothetical protein [uncultured Microbacterium sp.]